MCDCDRFLGSSYYEGVGDMTQQDEIDNTRQIDGDGGEEVIECHKCHEVLNGRSFWITDGDGFILCEICHLVKRGKLEEQ